MDKVKENSNRWLSSPRVSEEDKARIRSMSQEELDDAFFKDVELGTAGMRGVLGPGTNRMKSIRLAGYRLPLDNIYYP